MMPFVQVPFQSGLLHPFLGFVKSFKMASKCVTVIVIPFMGEVTCATFSL